MVGSTEISIFEVRRPSNIVCCILDTYRVEHVLPHYSLSENQSQCAIRDSKL